MARFALINPSNAVDRLATNVEPNVQTKPGWKWLPCDPVAPPSFDPAAEKVTGPTYTVGVSSVTEVWTKVLLTAPEIDASKDIAITGLNGTAFSALAKVLLNHENRIRALESKASINMVQFKAGVKALL